MIFGDLSAFIIISAIVFIWLLPFLIIGFSTKTDGKEKLAWILAVIFISWFAWIFYVLLAPLKRRTESF